MVVGLVEMGDEWWCVFEKVQVVRYRGEQA